MESNILNKKYKKYTFYSYIFTYRSVRWITTIIMFIFTVASFEAILSPIATHTSLLALVADKSGQAIASSVLIADSTIYTDYILRTSYSAPMYFF